MFHTLSASDVDYPPLLHRRCRMIVGDRIIANIPNSQQSEGLRVGFTINKSLDPTKPNSARVSIYNLNAESRNGFITREVLPVTIDAGYLETGLSRIFTGVMTNAVSRMEADGSYVTVLHTQDAPQTKKTRSKKTLRPGVSTSRVLTETLEDLNVGQGNLFSGGLDADSLARISKALSSGLNLSGNTARKMRRILETSGRNLSVQDGQAQVAVPGEVLSDEATYLSPATGLEGAPEVAQDGTVSCKTRIVPGLTPGYAVELSRVTHLHLVGTGWWTQDWTDSGALYKIIEVEYNGDTWGQDWTADLKLIRVAS